MQLMYRILLQPDNVTSKKEKPKNISVSVQKSDSNHNTVVGKKQMDNNNQYDSTKYANNNTGNGYVANEKNNNNTNNTNKASNNGKGKHEANNSRKRNITPMTAATAAMLAPPTPLPIAAALAPASTVRNDVKAEEPQSSDFKRLRSSNDVKYSSVPVTSAPSLASKVNNKDSNLGATSISSTVGQTTTTTQTTSSVAIKTTPTTTTAGTMTEKKHKTNSKSGTVTHEIFKQSQKSSHHHHHHHHHKTLTTVPTNNDLLLKVKYEEEKKCYTNLKKSSPEKPEIPKLKIDLKRATAELPSPDEPKPKIILKLPSPHERRTMTIPQPPAVDVNEYAKIIGLQPVSELKRSKEERRAMKEEDGSGHRKRKKAKHSKEPSSKKPKLHAEVSSMTLNDEVKLKVKISRTVKHGKRSNSIDDSKLTVKDVEVPSPRTTVSSPALGFNSAGSSPQPNNSTSPTPPDSVTKATEELLQEKSNEETAAKTTTPTPKESQSEPKVPSFEWKDPPGASPRRRDTPVPPEVNYERIKVQPTSSLLRTVRKPMVVIPSASDTFPTEKELINELIKKVAASVPKLAPKPATPKPATPPIVSTPSQIHRPVPSPPTSRANSGPSGTGQKMNRGQMPAPFSMFDIRMQRMSSPTRTFNPRFFAGMQALANANLRNFGMMSPHRTMQTPKRPTNQDCPPMPKTPRLDLMELNAQNRLMHKPVYAPMFDFQSKMPTKQPQQIQPKPQPQQQHQQPQHQSNKPSTNANDVKKMLPRLIAPSSISVTKVGEQSAQPPPQMNRPAVEILKIPSTVPTIDQQQNRNNNNSNKAIPLDKIRKSLAANAKNSLKIDVSRTNTESDKALDLSSPKLAAAASSVRKLDSAIIDLTETRDDKVSPTSTPTPPLKRPDERPKMPNLLPRPPTSNNTATAAQVPKLNRLVRQQQQQNMSVRNVPNPSALAFRNQVTPPVQNKQATEKTAMSPTSVPALTKTSNTAPISKLSDKIQQLHSLAQRNKITPED